MLYNCEETLLAWNDVSTIDYIEEYLHSNGIYDVNKSRIESANSLMRNRPARPRDYNLERKWDGLGEKFEFCEIF